VGSVQDVLCQLHVSEKGNLAEKEWQKQVSGQSQLRDQKECVVAPERCARQFEDIL